MPRRGVTHNPSHGPIVVAVAVAVAVPFGNTTEAYVAFSSNCINWVGAVVLWNGAANGETGLMYPQLIGIDSNNTGQQCYLHYMRQPAVYSKCRGDYVRRVVQFQIPNQPMAIGAQTPGQCGITTIQVMPP